MRDQMRCAVRHSDWRLPVELHAEIVCKRCRSIRRVVRTFHEAARLQIRLTYRFMGMLGRGKKVADSEKDRSLGLTAFVLVYCGIGVVLPGLALGRALAMKVGLIAGVAGVLGGSALSFWLCRAGVLCLFRATNEA